MISYIKIESDILNLPVGSAEKIVLAAGRLPKGCRMSNAQLARICGVSERSISRIVSDLSCGGLIEIREAGRNRVIETTDFQEKLQIDKLAHRQIGYSQSGFEHRQSVVQHRQIGEDHRQIVHHNLKSKRNKKEKAASRTKEPSGGALCSSPSEEKTSGHGGREKTGSDIGDFTMKEFREYIADRLGMKPGGENYASRAYELRIAIFTAGSRENAEFLEWVRKRRASTHGSDCR
ncbi:hypothetical protein [Sedimentisphaera salicampi]|uniref:hypothetical protein n=1 Tax=Sedimentisphaera salicampi TaxID=1941349 RepID=UPI000B9AFFD9|nr:hypothetical protein [Sedimentisphaera salicampi]OXU14725.1 hypothetical protein SMSP1_01545 [Sedimentisphaera salicampi]